jgi:hypothetical protein
LRLLGVQAAWHPRLPGIQAESAASSKRNPWRSPAGFEAALTARPCGLEPTMADHKFHIGQAVQFSTKPYYVNAALGLFEVTKQLPERDGEFEYRIKNVTEPHERVARESELSVD